MNIYVQYTQRQTFTLLLLWPFNFSFKRINVMETVMNQILPIM